ncbi:DUF2752 domain-containing protein [Flavobacterium sp. RSSA_27]|uniref:DUF2752 domain-containing protein n=1 Tax=Flavobacterium sp. RSSA_27 TaxID=3447667 RepID=UPI003F2FFBFC
MHLEKYMIPCLSKTLFGIECLGCGFQRALLLVLKGEWSAAFAMYPAVYSMLAMFCGVLFFYTNKKTAFTKNGLTFLIAINCIFVIGGYLYKHL